MKKTLGLAAVLILAAAITQAAGQGRLTGTVKDTAGNPIEGVTVLVTTPNLATFKMTLKTDKKGTFGAILNDATMPYHLRFEKDGYVPMEASKKVPIGDVGVVDVTLQSTSEAGAAAAGAAPSPSDQAALAYNEAIGLLNAGNKAGAEAKFLEAATKNPDLPVAWHALAQLAFEKKDWAKALEYGEKAVDLDPSINSLYPMLAEAAKQKGDTKAAAEWLARHAEANPESVDILYNKGVEAYNKGKMKDAEAALQKAVEVNPDHPMSHYLLGMASFNLNKKAQAKENFEKYLELDPNGKEAATVKELLPLLK